VQCSSNLSCFYEREERGVKIECIQHTLVHVLFIQADETIVESSIIVTRVDVNKSERSEKHKLLHRKDEKEMLLQHSASPMPSKI